MSNDTIESLLQDCTARATTYLNTIDQRSVAPSAAAQADLAQFVMPFPAKSTDPAEVLATLDQIGSPATVASAGQRYFGFVTGGSLPATLAANWLAAAWDQNSAFSVMSPVVAQIERVALGWMLDVLGLPTESAGGFVTGATMANFVGLGAARHALLTRAGWDVEAQGLFGAPPIQVVVGDEVHVSLLKALGMLGLGRERVHRVPTDAQGRMVAEKLPPLTDMTIVCTQAGNVNSGAIDPHDAICTSSRAKGAWVHVDGAFGLWAKASPQFQEIAAGIELADSWATDTHKWLNVPYDGGFVACRDAQAMHQAFTINAPYLELQAQREPCHYTPEMSRRARGIDVWAALYSLGREGAAALIERTCRHASRFGQGLAEAGFDVLNDVVLNQVLVSFGDDETTNRVIEAVQADGTCWCGGTVWHGRAAMRISVSSWATTDDDVERSLAAIIRVAKGAAGRG